ncbi:MAG: ferritin-like domain-containing protein [Minisyncoccota bacterium]
MISPDELYILSYYRACELAGSILFGRLALQTDFDLIRAPLTQHTLEEAEHAWLWTKVIKELGAIPVKVTDQYQTEYGKEYGMPSSILEILLLTQVFEKRTLNHFNIHLLRPGTHPTIKAALTKMIKDESGHISWVRKELDRYEAANGRKDIDELLKKMTEVDERVYARLAAKSPFREFFSIPS